MPSSQIPKKEDTELDHLEKMDAHNSGALIVYTSGTTGPPKGNLAFDFI